MTSTIKLTAAALTLAALMGAAGCQQPAGKAGDNRSSTTTPPATAPASADVHAFKIGALDAWALKDGDIILPVAGEGLPWSDKPAVTAALTAAGLPGDQVSLSVQPLLIKDGERVVLIDSGAGGQMGTANKLLASLRAAGVTPDQVTDVLISHAHGDHVGGLANAQGQLTFPNATIRMSAPEWAFAKAGAEAAGAGALLAAITPKVEPFQPGAQVTPSITAAPLRGHTPGHSGYEIVSGDQRVLYIGDALHSTVISVGHPEWENAWDEDKAAGIATRQTLLTRGASVGTRIYGVHFPFPGLGKFERRGDRYVWVGEPGPYVE